jgi:hypothetical protein
VTRPRPVLTATGIAGLITSLAGVLGWLGYVAPAAELNDRASVIGSVVIGAVALGSHLLAGLHAQSKVTPVEKPQDHDGTPLVRVDQAIISAVPAAPVSDVPDVEPLEVEPTDHPTP